MVSPIRRVIRKRVRVRTLARRRERERVNPGTTVMMEGAMLPVHMAGMIVTIEGAAPSTTC